MMETVWILEVQICSSRFEDRGGERGEGEGRGCGCGCLAGIFGVFLVSRLVCEAELVGGTAVSLIFFFFFFFFSFA